LISIISTPIHTNLNYYLPSSWEEEIHTPSPLETNASPIENLLIAILAPIKKNAASTGHQASPSPLLAPSPGSVAILTATRRNMMDTRLRGEITTVIGGGEDIDRVVDILMMVMMITIDVIGVIVGSEKRNHDNEIHGHESKAILEGFKILYEERGTSGITKMSIRSI
jgi:hypothetical protein